jgi:hypothetical protein
MRTTYVVLGIILLLLSIITSYAQGQLYPGGIVAPANPQSPKLPSQEYNMDEGYLAAQSIVFTGVPTFVSSITTDTASAPFLARHIFYLPLFVWVIIATIVWYFSGKPLPKYISFKEIREKNEWIHKLNKFMAFLIVASTLWWMYLYQTDPEMASQSLFYMLLSLLSISSLVLILDYSTTLGMIAIGDRILSYIDVPERKQQAILILTIVGLFFIIGFINNQYIPAGQTQQYQVAYTAAYAIQSGGNLRAENVAFSENRALIMLPTILLMMALTTLSSVLTGNTLSIVNIAKINPRKAFAILICCFITTATLVGFIGSSFHERSYDNLVPYVAEQTGLSQEEAKTVMLASVANFWSMGSASFLLSGSVLPVDIVHIFINSQATV